MDQSNQVNIYVYIYIYTSMFYDQFSNSGGMN